MKIAVIAMGLVILVGFIVVVVTIVQRLAKPAGEAPAGDIAVPVPPGCWIADGWPADGKLYLRLDGETPDCRRIVILDATSGKVVGGIVAAPTP